MTPKQAIERERCRRDAHYFIFDSGFLFTKDEHNKDQPVSSFPDLPYLRVILDCLLVSGRYVEPLAAKYAAEAELSFDYLDKIRSMGMLLAEKSRQIMFTWSVCAFALWVAKFHDYRLVLMQSKREDDAANLVFNSDPTVARISFMEVGLPAWMRDVEFPRGARYGHLFFPNGSHIWGIPEGGDIIRSNTASLIVSDEAAFQPEFGASYAAARPAIEGGGQFVGFSSAEPGDFGELIGVM